MQNHDGPLTIAFIESVPNIFTYKISKCLRQKGHKVILLSFLNFNKSFYSDAYDEIIELGFDSFSFNIPNIRDISYKIPSFISRILKLRNMNIDVYIGLASPYPLWLPMAACRIIHMFSNKPFIFHPYDVNILRYYKREDYAIAGISSLELKSEEYLFKNADGIIFKGNEAKAVSKILKVKSPVLKFVPYCTKEFIVPLNKNKLSKRDNEIHTVFVGFLPVSSKDSSSIGMVSAESLIKKIINQKIHFHVYSSQYDDFIKSKEFRKLISNKYFHLHKPFGQKEIIKEISKYDYGIWPSTFDFSKIRLEFSSHVMGNKLASYYEAGLPCIMSDEQEFIRSIAREYGLDIYYTKESILNLSKYLKKLKYRELLKNVSLAREDFLMEKHIGQFEEFLRTVIKRYKAGNNVRYSLS